MTPDPGWTSLEIAKLIVGTLAPLAIVELGFFPARLTRRAEVVQWANQTVVTHRVSCSRRPRRNSISCCASPLYRGVVILMLIAHVNQLAGLASAGAKVP